LRLVVRFVLDDRRGWRGSRGTCAIFCERLTREKNFVFTARFLRSRGPRAAFGTAIVVAGTATIASAISTIVVTATTLTAAVIATVAIVVAARIIAALIALWRSVFRRRKIAPAWAATATAPSALTAATTATASAATSETATTAVTASIATSVAATVTFRAAEILAAAIVARTTIVALRIFLRRVVMRREILRRGSVRIRLAFFVFVVRLEIAVGVTSLGANFVAGAGYIADVVVVVLVVMLMLVVMFVMLFAVCIGTSFGVSFAVLVSIMMLVVMFFALVRFGRAPLANRFAGQNFRRDGRGTLRRGVTVRIAMPMAMIVILKIFENVADVQEGIAVEADINEGGLHAGEDASNAAFVDATDQREFFFALDINFD
jgi:hypothetical protein